MTLRLGNRRMTDIRLVRERPVSVSLCGTETTNRGLSTIL